MSRGVFGLYKRVLYMDYAKAGMLWNEGVTTIKDLLDALNLREDADPRKTDLEHRLAEAVAIVADAKRPVSERVGAARSAGFDVALRGPEGRPRRVVFRGPGGTPRITYMYPRGKAARKRLHDAEVHRDWEQNRFARAD